jgi:hypothetical protein
VYKSSITSVTRTLSVTQVERPPTPPSETEVGPSTPRARTPAVPGQPRKTPGKNRYMVAAPEERDDDVERKLKADDDDNMGGIATMTPRQQTPPTPTQTVKAAVSSRPSRIAKPSKGRPLTAITDNRLADLTPGSSPPSMPRSKGVVKNLGTLFENIANGTTPTEARYNLRTGGSTARSTSATHMPHGFTDPSASNNVREPILSASSHPMSSPSKLPQKIPAKRKGATTTRSVYANSTYHLQEASQLGLGPRSTRRRRSSMGATDGEALSFSLDSNKTHVC